MTTALLVFLATFGAGILGHLIGQDIANRTRH